MLQVPHDAPPLDSRGREFWPPGWGPGARQVVESEQDLFQLLRIPYREPADRNCP
jgi:hypothetical protein